MTTYADPLELTAPQPEKPAASIEPAATSGLSVLVRDGITFQVATTRAEFNALEDEWTALYERSGTRPTIFQSFNWHWHWCNHFLETGTKGNRATSTVTRPAKQNQELFIVTLRRGGRLVMIWPLLRKRALQGTELVWIGDPVSQYGDCLAEGGADTNFLLQQSWKFITKSCGADFIYLRKVRADSVVAPLLRAQSLTVLERLEAVSHDLETDGDFDKYSERHKPRAKRNRRRQLRRMEEVGAVEFKVHPTGPETRDIALDAIAMKRLWLTAKGQVSRAYSNENFDTFFADLALGEDHPAGCCVSVLSCGDKTAAVEIGLNGRDTRFMHIIVYNLEFERFAAGAQHMMGSIRHSFDSGLKTFDLLAPNTRYKTDWADKITAVEDYATGLSVTGKAFVWAYLKNLRPGIKAAITRIPAPLTRVLDKVR